MPTDKVLARPEDAAETPPVFGSEEPLWEALQSLYRALHKTAIYPIGHPSIGNAVAHARASLAVALAHRGSVMIGVARDHLLVDRVPIEDGPAVLASLAQFLHELDVAVVELRSGMTVGELEQFLIRMREARQSGKGGAALAVALAEDKLENLRIFPLDYWGLSFGTRAGPDRFEGFDGVWDALVSNLGALTAGASSCDPETLAEEANHQFVSHEELGASALRQSFQAFGQQMRGMEDWQRDALRVRIGRFVGALNPSLRQDLLRVNPERPEESFEMMAELADTLQDDTLLDILRDINRSGLNVHDQFLNFLNKMARLPAPRTSAGVDLDSVVERWQISSAVQEKDTNVFRGALREVLLRRKQIECNPVAYQELLDELTHRELPAATRKILERYRNPADPPDVQLQAVELAVHLLQDGKGDEHAPGILAHIGAATDPLIQASEFQLVRDATAAARFVLASESRSGTAKSAASAYLRDFTLAPRIDRILDRVLRAEGVPGAVEPLLALGGRAAVDRIIDRLEGDLPVHVVSVLQSIIVNMGSSTMTEVLAARNKEGWGRLRPALPMIRLWPAGEGIALLANLASDPDSRVRREVLMLRCELDPAPGAAERYLRDALGDADPWIVMLAIQKLAGITSPQALEILGSCLEGTLPSRLPNSAHVWRIVKGLLGRGEDGLARACLALDTLGLSLRPSRARIGAIVRLLLEPERHDPRVAASLGRWRRSPGGVVAVFLASPSLPSAEERE